MPDINKGNLPTFAAGDQISAAKLNRLTDASRQQALAPGSYQSGAVSVQRKLGGGGGGGSSAGDYAIVITEAEANLGTPGRCIRIDADGFPLKTNGDAFEFDVTDPEAEGYDEEAIDDAALEFYSAHRYSPCTVGSRIRLTLQSTFRNDAMDKTPKWWGRMVDPEDNLRTRTDYANETGLTADDGEASGMKWTGEPCTTTPPE